VVVLPTPPFWLAMAMMGVGMLGSFAEMVPGIIAADGAAQTFFDGFRRLKTAGQRAGETATFL